MKVQHNTIESKDNLINQPPTQIDTVIRLGLVILLSVLIVGAGG